MSGITPLIAQTVDSNLIVSTESAKILASQFMRSPLEFWLPLITSLAAAFAAVMSYWTSRKSVELSHNLFLNDLNKEHDYLLRAMFEEYTPNLPLSNKNKISMCNFLEKLCHLYYDKVISKKEIYRYRANLFHKDFVDYANKNEVFGTYKRWLMENK